MKRFRICFRFVRLPLIPLNTDPDPPPPPMVVVVVVVLFVFRVRNIISLGDFPALLKVARALGEERETSSSIDRKNVDPI
jgi:hypothetical protein